jgi:hypothetical protein
MERTEYPLTLVKEDGCCPRVTGATVTRGTSEGQAAFMAEDGSIYGSSLPLMTRVVVTLPFRSKTVMFWLVGWPLFVLNCVLVVTELPSPVLK